MINSKRKGRDAEQALAKFLREHGIEARRGQQFKGTQDSPDVISNMNWHIECKAVESLNVIAAHAKCEQEAEDGNTPIVFHKKNRTAWYVTLKAEDFINEIRHACNTGQCISRKACR